MSRPFSGKRVRIPPKRETFPFARGESLLWEVYKPPYNAQRKLERTIKIEKRMIISLTIGWLFSIIIGFAISQTFGAWIFALTFIPILLILLLQLKKLENVKISLSDLQSRYPLSSRGRYQEYFGITNRRVISISLRNLERTSPESMREILFYDGDVCTGNLSSMTNIQVRNHWFHKTTLDLTFEKPAAAVPEMSYLPDYETSSMYAQYTWNFLPNIVHGIASYLYYSTFFASRVIFKVTLTTTEARAAYGILKNELSQI